MKDLDDFNKLEERALEWERILNERAQKSGQALNGIDERSEKTAYEMTEEYYANQKSLNEERKEE